MPDKRSWSLFAMMALVGCQAEEAVSPGALVSPADPTPAHLSGYTPIALGPVPVRQSCANLESEAYGVNGNGTIVGWVECGSGSLAVWWSSKNPTVANVFPGGPFSSAQAVNAYGVAVGWSGNQAAVWPDPQQVYTIGTLGGSYSWATDINDAGVIVGQAYLAGDQEAHAFKYYRQFGYMYDLGTLPGGHNSVAWAIAPNNVIVGESEINYTWHAVWWDAYGFIHDLGVLPSGVSSGATAVNAYNDMVGSSMIYYNNPARLNPHGFLRLHGTTALTDLGTPVNGRFSTAWDINDQGAIVGAADFGTGHFGALLLPGGTWQSLGTLPKYPGSWARAIGPNCRNIVGWTYGSNTLPHQAVLWTGGSC